MNKMVAAIIVANLALSTAAHASNKVAIDVTTKFMVNGEILQQGPVEWKLGERCSDVAYDLAAQVGSAGSIQLKSTTLIERGKGEPMTFVFEADNAIFEVMCLSGFKHQLPKPLDLDFKVDYLIKDATGRTIQSEFDIEVKGTSCRAVAFRIDAHYKLRSQTVEDRTDRAREKAASQGVNYPEDNGVFLLSDGAKGYSLTTICRIQ